jgi:class 3 adenylate cyclase
MHDRTNKTSICSIVFLDIIDYSKKSDADQIEVKNQFNDLINRSLKGIAQNDRIILDTGDGVAIAYMGSPEDAMFVALTIRDGILEFNLDSLTPLYVRFGINLGPVRIVTDINGQPNIIGDGINVAQRIMSFAQPNQILVSRSYYEVTSRLTLEFSEMFDYSGVKHDKHVREHEVYSVRPHKDTVINGSQPIAAKDDRRLTHRLVTTKKVNLKYAALALPAVIAFVMLIKSALDNSAPAGTIAQPPVVATPSALAVNNVKTNDAALLVNETVENLALEKELEIKSAQADLTNANLAKAKFAKQEANKKEVSKKAKQKEMDKMPPEFVQTQTANQSFLPNKSKAVSVKSATSDTKTADLIEENQVTKKKTRWGVFKESLQQGSENKCTQAQISMNQCS